MAAHIKKLDKDQGEIVEYTRQVILSADKEIGEQIKWNSPGFYYTGAMKEFNAKEYKRDIVVMNLHKGRVLLIFPTGDKIEDKSGLLEGDFKGGRRMVTITLSVSPTTASPVDVSLLQFFFFVCHSQLHVRSYTV